MGARSSSQAKIGGVYMLEVCSELDCESWLWLSYCPVKAKPFLGLYCTTCAEHLRASVQHDPVYNTVSVVNNHFHYQSWNAWVTHSIVRTQP